MISNMKHEVEEAVNLIKEMREKVYYQSVHKFALKWKQFCINSRKEKRSNVD